MNRTSRIRLLLGSLALFVPVLVGANAGTEHTVQLAAGAPNCSANSPSDGNENTGFGDSGNENPGDCDQGNGNTDNNVDGNANGPGADAPAANAQCTGSNEYSATC